MSWKQFNLQNPPISVFYSEAGRLQEKLCLWSHLLLHLLSLSSAVVQSWGATCSSEGAPLGSGCFSSWRWGKITLEHLSSALLKPNVGIQTGGGLFSVPIKTHCRPQEFWELGCLDLNISNWSGSINHLSAQRQKFFHNWPEEQPSNRGKCRYKSSAHHSPDPGSDKPSTTFLRLWDVDEVCASFMKSWVGNRAVKTAVMSVKCSKQVFKVCRHWNHISENDWVTQVIIKLDTTQTSSALCCRQWFTVYRAINPFERRAAKPGWGPATELWEQSWSLQADSSPRVTAWSPLMWNLSSRVSAPPQPPWPARAGLGGHEKHVYSERKALPLCQNSLCSFSRCFCPLSQPSFLSTLHQGSFPSDNTFSCLKANLHQAFTCSVIFLSVKWFKLPCFDNWFPLPTHIQTRKILKNNSSENKVHFANNLIWRGWGAENKWGKMLNHRYFGHSLVFSCFVPLAAGRSRF